jgi:hypothetical protein
LALSASSSLSILHINKIIVYEQENAGLAGLSTAQNRGHHHLLWINGALSESAYSTSSFHSDGHLVLFLHIQ